jgi:hypothetical protein
MRNPLNLFVFMALFYTGFALLFGESYFGLNFLEGFFTPRKVGIFLVLSALGLFVANYLGIFEADEKFPPRTVIDRSEELQETLRELRNYVVHFRPTTADAQINIDEEFKNQLLARLTTESQSALSSFVKSEVFKQAAKKNFKEDKLQAIGDQLDAVIDTYQRDMASWRKNANVNLWIGLLCAIGGIGVMWQTLIVLPFEIGNTGTWYIGDLYRFLARFGLVLIIESVAFFFLKLYREDRSMIRYFRNEITNLEAKAAALKTTLIFGIPSDLTKILQTLGATERNFLVKKGERVMTDLTYENSDILLEKLIERRPDLIDRIAKLGAGKTGS